MAAAAAAAALKLVMANKLVLFRKPQKSHLAEDESHGLLS
jgi:hypothetical protein